MKKYGLNELREKYLSFYESKEHLRLPSFSLVPQNDASLLLINAGMAPLKPYFTGKEKPPKSRVTTCQKCIRTPDIERVGKTARHGTFFEMLGNFSFGDYFKHEATRWAWEFVTKELELPIDRIWISIYEDDDEAFDIWTKEVGVAPDHIVRFGKEDNFWEIGTGPCGPCSELYFDRGEKYGCGSPDCKVGCECDRFVEFWNLVFTQFDKDENGNYNKLAHPNIDTGMGLERLAVIMQDVDNIFEVDTIKNIMEAVCKISGKTYKQDEKTDVSLRVITDHIRSGVFLISDGVQPSNEGRGYVLRRLLRRAARHGRLLGVKEPFLYQIAETVIQESGGAYPVLKEKQEFIQKAIRIEEERFEETINSGLEILNQYIADTKKEGGTVLSGARAFKLYDTYGFPIDLTLEIVEEQGITVDMEGFEKEMQVQRETARSNRKDDAGAGWDDDVFTRMKDVTTQFLGYTENNVQANILAIANASELVEEAVAGDQVTILLDRTGFYGESGGQVGDTGLLCADGLQLEVLNTTKTADGKYLHQCIVKEGGCRTGDTVIATYDADRRADIMRNHSATHLLQRALRDVLGSHVEQSGSLVTPERLRFDFTNFTALTQDELAEVESMVNRAVLAGLPVDISEMDIESAKKLGAMALFGEKYGKRVRVVQMGDYSIELCGGCHVGNTAQVGLFKILSESGVASGIRRIEAVTGWGVLEYMNQNEDTLQKAAQALKTNLHEVVSKAEAVTAENRSLQKELETLKTQMAGNQSGALLDRAKEINGVKVVIAKIDDADNGTLRKMGDSLKEKESDLVLLLAGVKDEKAVLVCMATKNAIAKGAHAGNIVREVAKLAGGGGGGKPDNAQAGAKDLDKLDDALAKAETIITEMIG